MTSERHLVRAAVFIILEKDNQILFIRRYNTGYRDGEYTLPAGHVEANETFIQAVVREAKEEVCIDILPESVQLTHTMQRHEDNMDIVDYYFSVSTWRGEPRIGEPNKADDLQWIPKDDVAHKAIPFVAKALRAIAHETSFSHDGVL